MGKATKIVLFGALGMAGFISAMQAMGDQLESTFVAEQIADGGAEPMPPAAVNEAAVVGETTAMPPMKPQPVRPSDLDDADRMIAATINLNGHLCARPVEIREVSTQLYGVHCITNRDGTGRSNYLVNSRTNEVTPI